MSSVVLAAAFAGAVSTVAIAQSQEITAALAEANKTLQKGGYAKAIEIIDAALRSGKIPSDLAGRALLMRAEANEKLGRTAFALADYNQALWMQGLSATDRKRAEDGKGRIMKGLGVAEGAGASAPAASEAPSRPTSQVSAPAARSNPDWNTQVQEQPSEERTGGIGSIFSGLFGSSSQPKPQQQQPVSTSSVARVSPPAESTGPGRTPAGAAQQAGRPAAVAQAPSAAPAARPPGGGNFSIQFAALLEEDKAIYEAERIAKRFGADLAGRTPTLMIVPTSDGGTLYKVVAGPYETRGESLATCELLKTKGVNCMIITRK